MDIDQRSYCANVMEAIWAFHDKPERWSALQQVADKLPGDAFLAAFVKVWIDSESNDLHLDLIDGMIERYDIHAERVANILGGKDLEFYRDLPDHVQVYRGTTLESPYGDYSWTTDRDQALWFALRCDKATPALASGTVKKQNAIFVSNSRDESEIAIQANKVDSLTLSPVGEWRENPSLEAYSMFQRGQFPPKERLKSQILFAKNNGTSQTEVFKMLHALTNELDGLGFTETAQKRRADLELLKAELSAN